MTKGDRDLSEVVEPLRYFDQLIVWDNRRAPVDFKVAGRFIAAAGARNDVLYVQDDDCVVEAEALARQFDHASVLCNMPQDRRAEYDGTGIALIGWGCIFPRRALDVFGRYLAKYPMDELFLRECDRVFTYLNRETVQLTEVGFTHLPVAFGDDRMGRERRHRTDFLEIQRRLAHVQ